MIPTGEKKTPPVVNCGAEKAATMGLALHIKQDLDAEGGGGGTTTKEWLRKSSIQAPVHVMWLKGRFVQMAVIQGFEKTK